MELSLLLGFVSRLATGGVWWFRVLRGVFQIACTKDCGLSSRPEDFWELPGKVVLAGAAYRVFRSTLQGLNQSIVGLSPLSETTYSTSHEIPNDGSWWILCLINCIVQLCLHWLANVVKIKPTRTCAKILKVRTHSLLLFSKKKLSGQKPLIV
jgi:hypothetical protein